MFDCERVDLSFFDAESWPRCTRTVDVRGGLYAPGRQRRVPHLGTVHPHGIPVQRMLDAGPPTFQKAFADDYRAKTRRRGEAGDVPGRAAAESGATPVPAHLRSYTDAGAAQQR
jgi:hypothetical protein